MFSARVAFFHRSIRTAEPKVGAKLLAVYCGYDGADLMSSRKKSGLEGWQENRRFNTVTAGSNRGFAAVLVLVLLVVAWWHPAGRFYWLGAAALSTLLGVVLPVIFSPFNKLWHGFGLLLGRIVTPVLMTAVFVLVVVPTGLLLRLFGKDVLRVRRNPSSASNKSYWIQREDKSTSFPRQF